MNYFKITSLFLTTFLFFTGCGSSGSSNNENNNNTTTTPIEKTTYSGYIEDSSGNYLSATIFMNDSSAMMTTTNENDEEIVYEGSFNNENSSVSFADYTCTQDNNSLKCNSFMLDKLELTNTINQSELEGVYKSADSSNIVWTMYISNGVVNIENDTNDCTLVGSVEINQLPYFEFEATSCSTNTALTGYAQMDSLYNTNDTLNLVVPNFLAITNSWTK